MFNGSPSPSPECFKSDRCNDCSRDQLGIFGSRGLARSLADSAPIAARQQIDAGNQAWIDGVKQGNVELITATYTSDAVDCSRTGNCIRGRSAIRDHMKEELAKLGKAQSASVASIGSVQQGRFVYEWGQAEASFRNGKTIVDRYLTAWQEQADGSWKIFRNLVIPSR